jgi:hypothetical protein
MNESNYAFLCKGLAEAGFNHSLQRPLRKMLKEGLQAFVLPYQIRFGSHTLAVTVFVRKWQDCPMYYLRKYHAVVKKNTVEVMASRDFFFGQMSPMVTLPEAYTLLVGGSIYRKEWRNKDRHINNSWIQLDFSRTDGLGNYGWRYNSDITFKPIT